MNLKLALTFMLNMLSFNSNIFDDIMILILMTSSNLIADSSMMPSHQYYLIHYCDFWNCYSKNVFLICSDMIFQNPPMLAIIKVDLNKKNLRELVI